MNSFAVEKNSRNIFSVQINLHGTVPLPTKVKAIRNILPETFFYLSASPIGHSEDGRSPWNFHLKTILQSHSLSGPSATPNYANNREYSNKWDNYHNLWNVKVFCFVFN